MNKSEAKRWACDIASTLIITDLDNGGLLYNEDPDFELKVDALKTLAADLKRRAGDASNLYFSPDKADSFY